MVGIHATCVLLVLEEPTQPVQQSLRAPCVLRHAARVTFADRPAGNLTEGTLRRSLGTAAGACADRLRVEGAGRVLLARPDDESNPGVFQPRRLHCFACVLGVRDLRIRRIRNEAVLEWRKRVSVECPDREHLLDGMSLALNRQAQDRHEPPSCRTWPPQTDGCSDLCWAGDASSLREGWTS